MGFFLYSLLYRYIFFLQSAIDNYALNILGATCVCFIFYQAGSAKEISIAELKKYCRYTTQRNEFINLASSGMSWSVLYLKGACFLPKMSIL